MTEHWPLNTAPLRVKLRVEDYLLLDGGGAFDDYRKTELIEGELLFMNAQHRPHGRVQSRLFGLLLQALPRGLEPFVEGSISIPPLNLPQPDIVVTSEPEGDGMIPLPSVRLIVEVSDTSLKQDLRTKAAIYARANIPEYWVADVSSRVLTQMWAPEPDGYGHRIEIAFGERISSRSIVGVEIDTRGL